MVESNATTTAEAAMPDIASNNSRRDFGATCSAVVESGVEGGAPSAAVESLALSGVDDFVGSRCCIRQLRG